jgi:hypothetical protein
MKTKAPVTQAALLKRINRRLTADDERLIKARGSAQLEYGDWLRINISVNALVGGIDDLEAYGRKVGVLQPWEKLAHETDR